MTPEKLKEIFSAAMPNERLSIEEDTLDLYSRDQTECEPGRPEMVAYIQSAEEILETVRLASRHKVPLVPRIAGTNLGGLSIPTRGGILLDLTAMNRIEAINETDMLAVIEPGVTFQQLIDELAARELPLTIGIPLSPPETSIMANCLLDGLGNL